jgi:hypothetical protein
LHACKRTPTLPRISCLQHCKWKLRSSNIPKRKKMKNEKINNRSKSKNKEDFNVRRLARIENLQSWEDDRRGRSWQQLQHGICLLPCKGRKDLTLVHVSGTCKRT